MTWKERVTPSGRVICALRASERRTAAKDFSGWPTPMAGSPATESYNEAGNTDSGRKTVQLVMGAWSTPDTMPDAPNTGTNATKTIQGLGN